MKLSKIISLTLAPILIFTFIGCSSSSKKSPNNSINEERLVYKLGEKYTSLNIDLDGDGTKEKVSCTFTKKLNDTLEEFTLAINGVTIQGDGYNLEGAFGIVDIDSKDKYKEIVISDWGPNDSLTTTFYCYDGKQIINMGTVSGLFFKKDYINPIKVDGSGKIYTLTRTKPNFFWQAKVSYKKTIENKLELVMEHLYDINEERIVAKPVTLQSSRTDTQNIIALKPGEKVTIISTDNIEWFLIRTSNGTEGWIKVGENAPLHNAEDVSTTFKNVD